MKVVESIAELRAALSQRTEISLVPTMGNLHQGHLSLVRLARSRGDPVVASIFVNPLQFAPHEDFAAYPRTLERDFELLSANGCDFVFTPSAREMYPASQAFKVQPASALADLLEGKARPGFFGGVCTVVLKLFNIVQPRTAVFGRKDYQQLLVVTNMVREFDLPIEIVAAETVREASGLAMSSRNGYLDAPQTIEAAQLYAALCGVARQVRSGRTDFARLEQDAEASLAARGWRADYVAIRRRADLGPPTPREPLIVLGAATLGATRLIDNVDA